MLLGPRARFVFLNHSQVWFHSSLALTIPLPQPPGSTLRSNDSVHITVIWLVWPTPQSNHVAQAELWGPRILVWLPGELQDAPCCRVVIPTMLFSCKLISFTHEQVLILLLEYCSEERGRGLGQESNITNEEQLKLLAIWSHLKHTSDLWLTPQRSSTRQGQ